MNRLRKPRWWLLNVLFIGMMAALFATQTLSLPPRALQLAQIVILAFGYSLSFGWVRANAAELEEEERQRKAARQERSETPLNVRQKRFRQVMAHRRQSPKEIQQ